MTEQQAAEIRALAEGITDPAALRRLLDIALDSDREVTQLLEQSLAIRKASNERMEKCLTS